MDKVIVASVRVLLDDREHVHVSSSRSDSDAVRAVLDAAFGAGYWTHAGIDSVVWNSARRALVVLFRRTAEALTKGGFQVECVDASAVGPHARVWQQEGLVMAIVDGLPTVAALKQAAGVFQAAMFSAGLSTPTQLGHAEPSVEGIVGNTLVGVYEPGENAPDFVDALREHHWRVDYVAKD